MIPGAGPAGGCIMQQFSNLSPSCLVLLQAEAVFVSKHDAIPFRCPCPPFIAPLAEQTPAVSSQGQRSQRRRMRGVLLQTPTSSLKLL
ncbi:hypothetical protein TNCV_3033781 [Trichonephila clavipes]|nr:hypothetical protein TNCV_3033781 [Trichonephila clavipes]